MPVGGEIAPLVGTAALEGFGAAGATAPEVVAPGADIALYCVSSLE